MSKLISAKNLVKTYFISEENEFNALNDIDIEINEHEFVAIVGQSGSGKSTLMNIIGALDKPTKGEYLFQGVDFSKLSDTELSTIRNKSIGFVFQTFNLVSRISALKNVEMPMLYAGVPARERRERAIELLKSVGMEARMNHMPNELSGGEKQRVAIARALANDPEVILADEPTGALDTKTGRLIMDIFHKLHDEQGKTIILITHSPELAYESERIISISDGRVISDEKNESMSFPMKKKKKDKEEKVV
jgi:putative ABC transport system ATP-binding protein